MVRETASRRPMRRGLESAHRTSMDRLRTFDAILPAIIIATVCIGACEGPMRTESSESTARASDKGQRPFEAPSPGTTSAATFDTVDVPSYGHVAFTIELPRGLSNVSRDRLVASYARSENDDAGPWMRVSPDTGPRRTLDDAISEAEQEGLLVLKSEKLGAGWLVATGTRDGTRLAVRRLIEGSPGLVCSAWSKGRGIKGKRLEMLESLESACRSVSITKA